jgi:hypothetical protein
MTFHTITDDAAHVPDGRENNCPSLGLLNEGMGQRVAAVLLQGGSHGQETILRSACGTASGENPRNARTTRGESTRLVEQHRADA